MGLIISSAWSHILNQHWPLTSRSAHIQHQQVTVTVLTYVWLCPDKPATYQISQTQDTGKSVWTSRLPYFGHHKVTFLVLHQISCRLFDTHSCPLQIDRNDFEILQRTHILLIFRFMILFWVTASIFLHALMVNKHTSLQCCSSVFPLCLKCCFSSCLFKPPPPTSKIPCLLWLVNSHRPESAWLTTTEQLCWISSWVPNYPWGIQCPNTWHGEVVWCQEVTEFKALTFLIKKTVKKCKSILNTLELFL